MHYILLLEHSLTLSSEGILQYLVCLTYLGVHSFGYSQRSKFMVSCGLERKIYLWDPFTCKVVHTLMGHNSSVKEVLVNDARNIMISLSVDKVRTYVCVGAMLQFLYIMPFKIDD